MAETRDEVIARISRRLGHRPTSPDELTDEERRDLQIAEKRSDERPIERRIAPP